LLTVAPAGGTVTGTVVDELVDVVEGAVVDGAMVDNGGDAAAVEDVVVELAGVVDGAEDVVVVVPGPAPQAGRAIHGIARSTVTRTAARRRCPVRGRMPFSVGRRGPLEQRRDGRVRDEAPGERGSAISGEGPDRGTCDSRRDGPGGHGSP
jgi:hypothetical protein